VYVLAEEAHGLLLQRDDYPRRTASGQYPIKAGGARAEHLIEHDLQVVEAIVGLVVAARRQSLSGVFLARELRIGTSAGALIPDAVLLLQFGGIVGDRLVPWTKVPSVSATVHSFAIESDRATEPHSTIAGKARLYAELDSPKDRQQWEERFRCPIPNPCWIAHTPQRAEAINQVWLQTWPRGSWIVTSPDQLAEAVATQVNEGITRRVRLFGGPVCSGEKASAPRATTTAASQAAPASQPAQVEATAASRQSLPASAPETLSARSPVALMDARTTSHPTSESANPPRQRILPEAIAAPPRPPAVLPAQSHWTRLAQRAPLPAFPAWLIPRRYNDPVLNIVFCVGLALWLPLWAALTVAERSFYGLLQFDELLAERLGRLRTALVWTCVISLLITTGWIASVAGRLRSAQEQTPLPGVWVVTEPAPALPSPFIVEPEPTAIPCLPAVVTADRVNLRLAPGLSAEKGPRKLSVGERVEVCGDPVEIDDHRWRLVRTENRGSGYVSDLYLELIEQSQE
jgi:hypothetical protein